MITLESLNRKYEILSNWEQRFRTELTSYIDKAISFLDGKAVLPIKYKSLDDAEKAGEDFYNQFPVSVELEDRHSFHHVIYVSSVYKQGNLYYVDGYDNTDSQWIEGWYTLDDNTTYSSLAYFVDNVLNAEDEVNPDDTSKGEKEESTSSVNPRNLIGYRIVDEFNFLPDELGEWDVFRTSADAESYMKEFLSPEGWQVVKVWKTPQTNPSKYTFLERKPRTFHKGEKVWVKMDAHPDFYTEVAEEVEASWPGSVVRVMKPGGDGKKISGVSNKRIFKMTEERGLECQDRK